MTTQQASLPWTSLPEDLATPHAGDETATTIELRPVKTGEVAAAAKKSCRTCFGTGHFFRKDDPGKEAQPTVCGCAFYRFMKLNAEKITYHQQTEAWFWL